MNLSELTIRNFRNLASLDAALPSDGVVILGDNGQGKTNLLEAVYYLVLFRSLRGAKDRELVRFGQEGFFVAGTGGRRVTAGYQVAGRRKKVTVDGAEAKKLSEAVGVVAAVAFAPADRDIVAGGPARRRRYLDVLLSLGEAGYLNELTAMRNALRQRNAALRRGRAEEAVPFDSPFARAAAAVAETRRRWVWERRDRYVELCRALGETGNADIGYHERHREEGVDAFHLERALGATLDRDLRRGMTTVGPHRDDLTLTLNERDLRTYGSGGQQRTAATALRLLEAETLRETTGSAPIALYDDVFAELDAVRQARLLDLIRETLAGQAIIAAPRESEVPPELLDRPRWRMERGRLER